MALEGRVKNTFEWFSERAKELEEKAAKDGGMRRHEAWRLEYFKYPYLLLETDETILERFADVFTNSLELSVEGKITPTPMMEENARLSKFFTEVLEETNWRGVLHKGSMEPAFEQVRAYFRDGDPLGVRAFQDLPKKKENHLFKFSKKEFVREMYKFGRFRISPASYYSKGSHLRAVKDLETQRHYRLKAINEVMSGQESIEVDGHKIDIVNGVVPINFYIDDYYLLSTCTELSRRMPTDFESDAVLVIKDKREFLYRIETELQISFPNWQFLEGDVYYYDSYNDLPKDPNQEFYKHISYAYQKEHRSILRSNSSTENETLSPFFIELGALDDICEVIYL